jgi:hypothetical protein
VGASVPTHFDFMAIPSRLYTDNLVTLKDSDVIMQRKMALNQEQSMGKYGFDYYNDTSAHTGPFCAIQACEATIVASMSGEGISITNMTLAAGQLLMGQINSVTLTSGSIVAYNSSN